MSSGDRLAPATPDFGSHGVRAEVFYHVLSAVRQCNLRPSNVHNRYRPVGHLPGTHVELSKVVRQHLDGIFFSDRCKRTDAQLEVAEGSKFVDDLKEVAHFLLGWVKTYDLRPVKQDSQRDSTFRKMGLKFLKVCQLKI